MYARTGLSTINQPLNGKVINKLERAYVNPRGIPVVDWGNWIFASYEKK
jgi:hypothetical protein